jgi:hypothetical protein
MTHHSHPKQSKFAASVALALSLSISSTALAAPGDTNSVNNGGTITGGTYYNTPDNKTTFTNNGGTGDLHLPTGQTVRGIEVNPWGGATGNGGTIHFFAPGGMVRLDGNVDVSGIINGRGAYIGNGGRVFVDSAMLFQNGSIFANGINGGAVQFNVGAAMFGPNAMVQANGFGGTAGTISVNSSGIVDLQKGAIFDASGRSISYGADNVNVNIVGSLVNNEGIITANGIAVNDGHVTLLAADKDAAKAEYALASELDTPWFSTEGTGTNGGVIRLVATGQTRTDCLDCVTDKAVKEGTITADEALTLQARQADLVARYDGDIINRGTIQANGADGVKNSRPVWNDDDDVIMAYGKDGWGGDSLVGSATDGGNGGVIIASAADDITNTGLIQANGGNGGHYNAYEGPILYKTSIAKDMGPISMAGKGGNGGVISLSATDTITNGTPSENCQISDATIEANGGKGGHMTQTAYASSTAVNTNGDVLIELNKTDPFLGKPAAIAGVNATVANDNIKNDQLATNAIADNSGYAGGQGGDGGAIAISYGKSLVNDGTITAKGGKGGDGPDAEASASTTTNESTLYHAYYIDKPVEIGRSSVKTVSAPKFVKSGPFAEDAVAIARATGGKGGDGGNGGIVVLSGPANPTGSGVINVNGGKGGRGGDASATTYAESTKGLARAESYATAGAGGSGGNGGYVVAPNTTVTFHYKAKNGAQGKAGEAHAAAEAHGAPSGFPNKPNFEFAKAVARGNGNSTATATGDVKTEAIHQLTSAIDTTHNDLIQTQNNELLIHGNTAILMTKGGNLSYLTDRLSDAYTTSSVRSVDQPFGNVYKYAPIRHFVVASTARKAHSVILNKPEGTLDGLTSFTVLSNGKLVEVPCGTLWSTGIVSNDGISLASGGGHLSIVAPKADIINGGYLIAGGIHTGGSITLAGKTVKNGIDGGECESCNGAIITGSANPYYEGLGIGGHGGSIILKGKNAVENLSVNGNENPSIISSGVLTPSFYYGSGGFPPTMIGGTIRMQSLNGLVFNEGIIKANGLLQGGSIITKAYTAAINNGTVEAKATGLYDGPIYTSRVGQDDYNDDDEYDFSLTGSGGFIRWHGNGLSVNNFGAVMDVTGPSQGGVIQLTAGGPTTLDALTLPGLASGLGITQGTLLPTDNLSLVTSAGTLPLGSAFSAGFLDARATNEGGTIGKIDIAGDGFAGLEANSVVNGVTVGTDAVSFFSNPAIGSNVRLIAGEGAVKAVVCGGDIPKNPERPNTPPVVKETPFRFELGGLPFQYYRPDTLTPPVPNKLVLRLGKSSSFLAKAYTPVTQEILTLALKEYNRELALGHTVDRAMAMTQLYLKDSGVDADIAVQLVEAVKAGSFTVDAPVLLVLEKMSAEAGPVIRQ